MKPPVCAICGRDFEPSEGGLVSFRLTDSDEEWLQRSNAKPGFVGHPPWKDWFCETHIEAARKLQHLTRQQAMAKLKTLS